MLEHLSIVHQSFLRCLRLSVDGERMCQGRGALEEENTAGRAVGRDSAAGAFAINALSARSRTCGARSSCKVQRCRHAKRPQLHTVKHKAALKKAERGAKDAASRTDCATHTIAR